MRLAMWPTAFMCCASLHADSNQRNTQIGAALHAGNHDCDASSRKRVRLFVFVCMQNILDACVGAIAFYLVGYGFAFGHKPGSPPTHFIGNWDFALISTEKAARAALHNNPGSTAGFATMGWHVW